MRPGPPGALCPSRAPDRLPPRPRQAAEATRAVRNARTATLLGGCEIKPLSSGAANLSFWTCPRSRGRGVASRAVALACTFAFEAPGLRRIEILADPHNGPSRRVAVRNGLTEAGIRDGRVLYVADAEPPAGGRAH